MTKRRLIKEINELLNFNNDDRAFGRRRQTGLSNLYWLRIWHDKCASIYALINRKIIEKR